jgi:hypothetical protein
LYDLANVVPTLAKFYHQASEAYEQACTRHISIIILYVSNPIPGSFLWVYYCNVVFLVANICWTINEFNLNILKVLFLIKFAFCSNLKNFSSLLARLRIWCSP